MRWKGASIMSEFVSLKWLNRSCESGASILCEFVVKMNFLVALKVHVEVFLVELDFFNPCLDL